MSRKRCPARAFDSLQAQVNDLSTWEVFLVGLWLLIETIQRGCGAALRYTVSLVMRSLETPNEAEFDEDKDDFADASNVPESTICQVPKSHRAAIAARLLPVDIVRSQKFYAVRRGYRPSVYLSWDNCKIQVDGFRGAEHKSFRTLAEAKDFLGLCHSSVR
ncbi:hypothetical protein KC19_2G010600 [Ceratodon purpureus]|uniref:ribonuclease H n=1 Tax=Ceratodon purpureus TaxID=3225 RepID=A0A8T0INR9_CERPU|nr:hypothetical protein KC19_2G010600 [Ceratodon purpureus]